MHMEKFEKCFPKIIGFALEWCCSVLQDYPDFVPGMTYGSLSDQSVKDQWGAEGCDTRVGGSSRKNCKGMWGEYKGNDK